VLHSVISAHGRLCRSRRARSRFVAAACSFIELFGDLLLTEDHMLLRLAEESLGPEADALLVREFDAIDSAHAPVAPTVQDLRILPLAPSRPGRPSAPRWSRAAASARA
jgi:hypothetical protein